jgi:hypothetical protein
MLLVVLSAHWLAEQAKQEFRGSRQKPGSLTRAGLLVISFLLQ